ncbi:MAG: tyrosine-type recombinase/integrase [Hyphomicrobiaceae bacterium]|nr:tyrosine-type recombinase/integrase [Hyphomicrobiaceae bacterium]
MSTAVRLTKRLVDGMKPGDTLHDAEVKGFAVRCQRRSRVYLLRVRLNGRQRWITIGQHGAPWTVETAREEAQRLWGKIRSGIDVVAVREAQRSRPTVRELCMRFMDEHSRQHNKPNTILGYERNNRNHILPILGDRLVADITRKDIEDLKRKVRDGQTHRKTIAKREGGTGGLDVTGGPGAANRTLGQLSKMFNLAELWGWRPENSNPVRHVIRYKGRKMERFLSTEELTRLGDVLNRCETESTVAPAAIAAIRLLIYTGARRGEILTLKWSYVDFERRMLLLPDSKTGAKPIMLNQPAIDVLKSIPVLANNPWVLTGRLAGDCLQNIEGPWKRIRTAAGLEDVRLHDLRHSFASFAVLSGGTLPVIGKLLGHTTPLTTARYAHLAHSPVSELAETTGAALAQALGRRA